MNRLDRFFEISERQSTITAEIRGGVVTFIAMAYIVVLNPIILSGTEDVDGNSLEFAQVSATTSLAAGLHDDAVRRRRAASVRVRRGPGHQLLPRDDRGRFADLARGDGPRRDQRAHHRDSGGDRAAQARLRRRADAAETRDHGRHRNVHPLHRARRRRLHRLHRAPITARRAGHRRHRFDQHRPDGRLRAHAAGDRHPGRPAGTGRHSHRTGGRHPRRGRHRGDLAARVGGRAPRWLEPLGTDAVRFAVRAPRPLTRRRVQCGQLWSHRRSHRRQCSCSRWCSRTSSTR